MKLYDKLKKSKIDLSRVGLEKGSEESDYFCSPLGAKVIGWAGVDGIYFCMIEDCGDMVFAVSPMNEPGNYVHPVANSFEDFLRLLISCSDTAVIEQAHQWDRELYNQFICDNQPTEKQCAVLGQLQKEFQLEPIVDPSAYMETVRKNFNYRKLRFSEDYYEWAPAEPLVPQAPEWKITFHGDFHSVDKLGTPGTPIPVNKAFQWAEIDWIIPEIYACEEGLIILTYGKVDPDDVRKHIIGEHATPEDIERMDAECPLNIHLKCKAKINGSDGVSCGGSGLTWIPPLPDEGTGNLAARWALEHYGLDVDSADGPTAVCLTHPVGEESQLRMVSSSLHFETVKEVEWRIVFLEKLHEDITVQVICFPREERINKWHEHQRRRIKVCTRPQEKV